MIRRPPRCTLFPYPPLFRSGTVGSLTPFLGPVTIPEGTYFIAVSSNSQVPVVLNQYSESETVAPLMRLEPLDSIGRVAEDHVMEPILSFTDLEAPYEAPDQPLLFGVLEEEEVILVNNIVPFHLGDMTLLIRPEGRRVGKGGKSRWAPCT